MTKLLVGNSIWQLIVISDTMSKLILLLLLGMSIVCWTVFFYKIIMLRIKRKQLKEALLSIKSAYSLEDMLTVSGRINKTVPGYFLNSSLLFTKDLLQRSVDKNYLVIREWEIAEQNGDHLFVDIIEQEEQYMPVLYSCAGVATLIGLFGTVWGLVHAFVRIGEKQSADIATVAPGIAEALITTLAGLMVAIPAYVMFHYLSTQTRKLETQLNTFVDIAMVRMKRIFVKEGV